MCLVVFSEFLSSIVLSQLWGTQSQCDSAFLLCHMEAQDWVASIIQSWEPSLSSRWLPIVEAPRYPGSQPPLHNAVVNWQSNKEQISLFCYSLEIITHLNNVWEKIWVEMRPINPSNVNNHFNKLVSYVGWKLLVVWQKKFIEKSTDICLICWWCSYPLFIYQIL